MSKEALAKSVNLMSNKGCSYDSILEVMPVVEPEQWEVDAIKEAREDRAKYGTVAHEDINWK